VLFGPLLFPSPRQVGVHEVHFAMVAILAMGVGLFAPPFGVGYYVACAIGRCNPDERHAPYSAATCRPRRRAHHRRRRTPISTASLTHANTRTKQYGGNK